MASYLLMLYDNPTTMEGLSAEDMQRMFEKYMAWSDELEAKGQRLGGEKLTDGEGRVLRKEQGDIRVLDGPYGETKEVIGGFFMIKAESYDEAVEIARTCPHVAVYGSTVEVREIEEH